MAFDGDDGAIEISDDTGGGAGGGGDEGANDDEIESPGSGEGEGDGADDGDGSGDRRDGGKDGRDGDAGQATRDLPKQIRTALRELNASNPDFAKQFPRAEKEISGALYKSQQIDSLGGVAKITEALEAIEARGGLESIESMAADLDAANQFEAALDKGDPKAFETWAKESPNGFARAVLPMFEQLGRVNEERYEQVGSAVVASIFEKFGAFSVVAAMGKALTDGKTDDAVARFNELATFLGSVKRLGGLAKTDPHASRSQELDQREQDIAAKDTSSFKAAVRADVNTEVTSKMNSELRKHLLTLGVRNVSSGTANRMRRDINIELQKAVNGRQGYADQYNAVMATKDRSRAAKFILAAADRALPQVIKDVVKDFNLKDSGKQQRRSPVGRGAGGGGERSSIVSGRPKVLDVDFTRTDKAKFLASRQHGDAWLNNGKQAKW